MAWNEVAGTVIIGIGVLFDFLGCIGLLRLPDVYNRLQAGTKCVTFGTCGILLGIFMMYGLRGPGLKALAGIPFLLVASPAAAHAIARGAYRFGVKLWTKSVIDLYRKDQDKTD